MAILIHGPLDDGTVQEAVLAPSAGAVLTFSGTVRDQSRGRRVTGIEYHAYEGMARKELQRIEDEVRQRWPGARASIAHRLGHLQVGESSVLIAVSSPHRAEGFEALRYAIEAIKQRVPIWKKETYVDGHAWIEGS